MLDDLSTIELEYYNCTDVNVQSGTQTTPSITQRIYILSVDTSIQYGYVVIAMYVIVS